MPPRNDVDVFAHDLGFIAIVEDGRIVGYNVTIGGGMGMTHGEPDTFPRLGDVVGFCLPEQAIEVAEKVMTVQRDWGNRSARKHARVKYTSSASASTLIARRWRSASATVAAGAGVRVHPPGRRARLDGRLGRDAGPTRCSSRTAASATCPAAR